MELKQENKLTRFLLPSALYVAQNPCVVTTILGSCVSVCLHDPILKQGGINHYMLPFWNGEGLPSPKYGNIAIHKLIEKMEMNGSKRGDLVAKVFGGAEKSDPQANYFTIGKRNIQIAEEELKANEIKITGRSLGGFRGRKLQFHTDSGEVLMKFILKEL